MLILVGLDKPVLSKSTASKGKNTLKLNKLRRSTAMELLDILYFMQKGLQLSIFIYL